MSTEDNKFLKELSKKKFFSRFSNAEVIFVDKIPEDRGDMTKAYFDGMFLLDNVADVEDDIQQVNSITKDGDYVNLEDFYADEGAFDKNGGERFYKAICNLMDKEEYDKG